MMAIIIVGIVSVVCGVLAADSVEPASCTFTNNRNDTISYVTDTEYYRGTSILFTNCVLQTTGTVAQGLSAVTVELKWGTSATNHTYTANVQDAAAGKWWLSMTIPTNWEAPNIQIKVTDAATNSYIYPWKLVHTKASM